MWPYPKIVAHRGGGKLAPENTLAAMRCGLAHGFHAVEFDVMLSSDGVPVLMHDPDFGRTIAGSGKVSAHTAQELRALDAGSWFGPEFAGEPVATLEQVFHFCMSNRIWMNVEIKPTPGFEMVTGRIVVERMRCLLDAQTGNVEQALLPLVSSFSYEALAVAKQAAPDVARGYLVDTLPCDWRKRLDELGAIALHTNHKNLSRERAQAVKSAGFGLFCYTVNEVDRAREILSWGVDAFCTDRIDLIGPDFC